MTETTERLALPLLAASQSQKHVTHNEALVALDALVQLAVRDRQSAPPDTPEEADRYIVAGPGSGAWSGQENAIAACQDGAWQFFQPGAGWTAWVASAQAMLVFDGTAWSDLKPRQADTFGIATTADAGNRLAVASPAVLFNHAGEGSQVKINKRAGGDTASLLFQTDWSGRAEFGLAGDDDYHVKVSADGATWQEAMIADATSGAVRFPAGLEHAVSRAALSSMILTPGGDGEVSILRFDRARSEDPRQAVLAAIAGDVLTLTTADADLFFDYRMRNVSCIRVWNISKSTPQPAWIKWDAAADQLQVTDSGHITGWAAGDTIQLGDIAGEPGVPASFTRGYALDISPLLQNRLGVQFRQKALTFKCMVYGVGTRVGLAASADTTSGSFFGGNSLSDGGGNVTMHLVPTTELSPISDSNLVYVREDGAGPGVLSICGLSVAGVWV